MADSGARHEDFNDALKDVTAGIAALTLGNSLAAPAAAAAAGVGALPAAVVALGAVGGGFFGDAIEKVSHGAASDGIAAGMHWLADSPATDMKVADQAAAGHLVDAAGTYVGGVLEHMGKLLDSIPISPGHQLADPAGSAPAPHSGAAHEGAYEPGQHELG